MLADLFEMPGALLREEGGMNRRPFVQLPGHGGEGREEGRRGGGDRLPMRREQGLGGRAEERLFEITGEGAELLCRPPAFRLSAFRRRGRRGGLLEGLGLRLRGGARGLSRLPALRPFRIGEERLFAAGCLRHALTLFSPSSSAPRAPAPRGRERERRPNPSSPSGRYGGERRNEEGRSSGQDFSPLPGPRRRREGAGGGCRLSSKRLSLSACPLMAFFSLSALCPFSSCPLFLPGLRRAREAGSRAISQKLDGAP
jgi:hypothetical protein